MSKLVAGHASRDKADKLGRLLHLTVPLSGKLDQLRPFPDLGRFTVKQAILYLLQILPPFWGLVNSVPLPAPVVVFTFIFAQTDSRQSTKKSFQCLTFVPAGFDLLYMYLQ